jgi:hypothetical protein
MSTSPRAHEICGMALFARPASTVTPRMSAAPPPGHSCQHGSHEAYDILRVGQTEGYVLTAMA